jgi:hypothetical protein
LYRCDKCNSISSIGDKENRVVVETRKKTYKNRIKTRRGHRTKTSEGFETVREIKLCGDCYGDY